MSASAVAADGVVDVSVAAVRANVSVNGNASACGRPEKRMDVDGVMPVVGESVVMTTEGCWQRRNEELAMTLG